MLTPVRAWAPEAHQIWRWGGEGEGEGGGGGGGGDIVARHRGGVREGPAPSHPPPPARSAVQRMYCT